MNRFQSTFCRFAALLILSLIATGAAQGQGAERATTTTATLGRAQVLPSFHVDAGSTLMDALDRFGKQCGITIRVEASSPDAPESIDYVKNLRFPKPQTWTGTGANGPRQGGAGLGGRALADGVSAEGLAFGMRTALALRFDYQWRDDRTLVVFANGFESLQEGDRRASTLKTARDKFFDDEEPKTQIYRLEGVSAKTAFALIQRELTRTGLWRVGGDYLVLTAKEAVRRGLGEPLNSVEDTAALDDAAGTAIVTATPETHARIRKVLDNAADFLKQSNVAAPIRQYRIELALLRGVPQGAAASTASSRLVRIFSKASGTVVSNDIVVGRAVAAGTKLVELSRSDLGAKRRQLKTDLELIGKQRALAEEKLRHLEELVAAGKVAPAELQDLKSAMLDHDRQISKIDAELEEVRAMEQDLTILAPVSGRIAPSEHALGINEPVMAGSLIAVIEESVKASDSLSSATAGARLGGLGEASSRAEASAAAGLKELGLSPSDLKELGVSSYGLLGRSTLSLNNLPGNDGTALVTLAGLYQCKLTYVDRREPLLIVRAALLSTLNAAQTLTENTLFLEKGKPAVLGLSNMQEALILVVRERGEVSVSSTGGVKAAEPAMAAASNTEPSPAGQKGAEGDISEAEARAMAAAIGKAILSMPKDTRKAADVTRDYRGLFGSAANSADSEFLKPYTSGPNAGQQSNMIDGKYYGFRGASFVKSLGANVFQIEFGDWNTGGTAKSTAYKVTLEREAGRVVVKKDERLP